MSSLAAPSLLPFPSLAERPPPENGLMFGLYHAPRVAATTADEGGECVGKRAKRFDAYEFVSPEAPFYSIDRHDIMEGSVVT